MDKYKAAGYHGGTFNQSGFIGDGLPRASVSHFGISEIVLIAVIIAIIYIGVVYGIPFVMSYI